MNAIKVSCLVYLLLQSSDGSLVLIGDAVQHFLVRGGDDRTTGKCLLTYKDVLKSKNNKTLESRHRHAPADLRLWHAATPRRWTYLLIT